MTTSLELDYLRLRGRDPRSSEERMPTMSKLQKRMEAVRKAYLVETKKPQKDQDELDRLMTEWMDLRDQVEAQGGR